MEKKEIKPLCDWLEKIPDPRSPLGRRYSLRAILLVSIGAMLCGYDNPNQIAIWGAAQEPEFLKALGCQRGIAPKKSALYEVLSRIDAEALEQVLGQWSESVFQNLGAKAEGEGVSIDGKALRGSRKQGAEIAYLLSAVSHSLGITLGQVSVDGKTNEIPRVEEILKSILVNGRVFTMDALLTQRTIARQIVDQGGDYVMALKGNQSTIYEAVETHFRVFSPSNSSLRLDD